MDGCRLRLRPRLWLLGLLAAAICTGGCANVLFTAAYLWNGTNVDPDFVGLKKKRVVIVCRPLVNLQYEDSRVAKDLAAALGRLLRDNSKAKVVEQRKVERWTDENTWENFADVGKAFDADLVLGIDLEYFHLYQGLTLYQGKANISIQVVDLKPKTDKKDKDTDKDSQKKDGKPDAKDKDKDKDEVDTEVVFEKQMQIVFPPNNCVSTSDKPENAFRHDFIATIAEQISHNFCSHDPDSDIGSPQTTYGL